MQQVKGNPGGLRYTEDLPTDQWGARGQLKTARHGNLLEVLADISFGAGTKKSLVGRSVPGRALCELCSTK